MPSDTPSGWKKEASPADDHPRTAARNGPGRSRPPTRRRPWAELTALGKLKAATHAARTVPDFFTRPDLDQVKLPDGTRPVFDKAEAASLLEDLPEAAFWRSDTLRTARPVWAAVVDLLHPETGLAIAGYATIAERATARAGWRIPAGTARSHIKRFIEAGLLFLAQPGCSKEVIGVRDRAPSYILLAADDTLSPREQDALDDLIAKLDAHEGLQPGESTTSAPTRAGDLSDLPGEPVEEELTWPWAGDQDRTLPYKEPRTRVEEISHSRKAGPFSEPQLPKTPARREQPWLFAPRNAAEREFSVIWLVSEMGWNHSERNYEEVRKITRQSFRDGWCARAILKSWYVRPNGEPFEGPLNEPRHQDHGKLRGRNWWAILTWRANHWRDALGHMLPPPIEPAAAKRGRPKKTVVPVVEPIVRRLPAGVLAELQRTSDKLGRKTADDRILVSAEDARRHALYAELVAPLPPVFAQPSTSDVTAETVVHTAATTRSEAIRHSAILRTRRDRVRRGVSGRRP